MPNVDKSGSGFSYADIVKGPPKKPSPKKTSTTTSTTSTTPTTSTTTSKTTTPSPPTPKTMSWASVVSSGTTSTGSTQDQQEVRSTVSTTSSTKVSGRSKTAPVPRTVRHSKPKTTPPLDFTSLLTKSGKISVAKMRTMIPDDVPDTFVPSRRIDDGEKYSWTSKGHTYEVKFHSPDRGAPSGSNSASGWTAQIKVDGKLMTQRGQFRFGPRDFTHIPLLN